MAVKFKLKVPEQYFLHQNLRIWPIFSEKTSSMQGIEITPVKKEALHFVVWLH